MSNSQIPVVRSLDALREDENTGIKIHGSSRMVESRRSVEILSVDYYRRGSLEDFSSILFLGE
jgi:hypothetical protein